MKTALAVKDLSHSYGRRSVLNSISFSVQEGEFFIIIGPNGSHKNNSLKPFRDPSDQKRDKWGILGRPIGSYSGKALARSIAVVTQTPPADVPFTVAEVV